MLHIEPKINNLEMVQAFLYHSFWNEQPSLSFANSIRYLQSVQQYCMHNELSKTNNIIQAGLYQVENKYL